MDVPFVKCEECGERMKPRCVGYCDKSRSLAETNANHASKWRYYTGERIMICPKCVRAVRC